MAHISNEIRNLPVEKIEDLNKYHCAPEKEAKYAEIRKACSALMKAILENAPECADRTTALQTVRLARMWSNSAIALDGIE